MKNFCRSNDIKYCRNISIINNRVTNFNSNRIWYFDTLKGHLFKYKNYEFSIGENGWIYAQDTSDMKNYGMAIAIFGNRTIKENLEEFIRSEHINKFFDNIKVKEGVTAI